MLCYGGMVRYLTVTSGETKKGALHGSVDYHSLSPNPNSAMDQKLLLSIAQKRTKDFKSNDNFSIHAHWHLVAAANCIETFAKIIKSIFQHYHSKYPCLYYGGGTRDTPSAYSLPLPRNRRPNQYHQAEEARALKTLDFSYIGNFWWRLVPATIDRGVTHTNFAGLRRGATSIG